MDIHKVMAVFVKIYLYEKYKSSNIHLETRLCCNITPKFPSRGFMGLIKKGEHINLDNLRIHKYLRIKLC